MLKFIFIFVRVFPCNLGSIRILEARISGITFFLLISLFFPINGQGQEKTNDPILVENPNLPVIATLIVGPQGQQAIVYNPKLCDEAGKLVCTFYLTHENAHILLKHAINNVPSNISEPEADCKAAKMVTRETAIAVYNWFMSGATSPKVHGSSAERAAKIRVCAEF